MERCANRDLLRSPLERDDWKVPLCEELNRQIEPDSGLTADENLGRSAPRSARPARAGLKARHPTDWATMVIDLIGSRAAQPRVRTMCVVPGSEERQLPLKLNETVRDQN